MGVSIGDLLIMIIGLILFIVALIVLLNHIMAQLYFFTLDPSKAVALDISMRILSSMSTPGKVEMEYKNITTNIFYTFSDANKVFCVSARSQIATVKMIDCVSLPFEVNLNKEESLGFKLKIKKWFNRSYEKAEVDVEWLH
ncbi:MAG: hypothetical protein QW228_09545 [Candidatus Aenigmatarchaeota archaeon]